MLMIKIFIAFCIDSLEIEDMNDTSFLQIRNHVPPSENKQTLSKFSNINKVFHKILFLYS